MNSKFKIRICSIIIPGILLGGLCILTDSNLFVLNTVCLWGLGWLYLSIFCFYLMSKDNRKSLKIKVIALFLTVLIMLGFPIKYGNVLTNNYHERRMLNTDCIMVVPLQDNNVNATAAEIWIADLLINDVKYDLHKLILPEGWQILDECLYCADARTAQPLKIEIPLKSYYEIEFIMTEASGKLLYSADGAEVEIDLYSNLRTKRNVSEEEIWGRVTEASRWERTLYYMIYAIILWVIIYTVIQFLNCYYKTKIDRINSELEK